MPGAHQRRMLTRFVQALRSERAFLPVRDAATTDFHEVPWLASRVEVASTPSVSALARLRALPPVGSRRR